MKKRFIATILFFLLFTIVCVYVIILGQGNKIESNGSVVNTSIIRVNSIPTDVVVYINDKLVNLTQNRVEWLNPGETKVTLKKDGYKSWEKIINLKAGVVEDIYAQLYPERLQFDRLTSKNVDHFYLSYDSTYLYYTIIKSEIPTDIGIWRLKVNRNLLDFSQSTPEKVYSFSSDIQAQLKDYEIILSPDNSKAFLNLKDLTTLYLIDFSAKNITNINKEVGFYAKNIKWFEGSNSAVFSTDQLVTSFDVNSKQLTLIYFSSAGAPIYSVGSNVVYYYRKDLNQIFKYQNKVNSIAPDKEKLTFTEDPLEIISGKESDNLIFIRTAKKYFFVDFSKDYVTTSDVKGNLIKVSPNGLGYLEEIDSTNLSASYFELNLDNSTYSINSNDFIVQAGLEFLDYTQNSRNLIFVLKNADSREVWISDFDGLNLVPVIQNEVIANKKVLIGSNSTDLYVLLEDSSSAIDSSKVNNIYRFKLQLQ